jgi:hypothetical protein
MCQPLTPAQSRVFDILVNDVVVASDVNVYASAFNVLYRPIEISNNMSTADADGTMNITLAQNGLSSLPPILNALEVYSIHVKNAGTLASDGTHFSFSCLSQIAVDEIDTHRHDR